ncbi:MAG: ABC transporter ATP-binding protein [Gammaproteobacteria bacterium]|nr:ABC transporter ATP-binding protein [Gammaproteobacteria bacterium]
MKNKQAAIELEGVVKRYGDKVVVNDVDLTIKQGECLLLVGHNGAGKTTLMKLILGLTRANGGKLRVLGDDPTRVSSVVSRGQLGFLPELVAFQQAMTGKEVLTFYARLKGCPVKQCNDLLERVGLQTAANQRVQTYSKGMRQRLGLAQALLGDPKLLLLDEPTTGLDPSLRQHFYNIIGDMQAKGTTSLISSHALNAFETRVDRIAMMKSGHLLACGSLTELGEQTALPIKMRITVAEGQTSRLAEHLGDNSGISQVNGHSVNLECVNDDKMIIIRRIAELGDTVKNIDIIPPRLDDIYSYYMQEHIT